MKNLRKGQEVVITAQAFCHVKPGANKIQVYTELRYPPFHMSMNCEDIEKHFENISQFVENAQ